MSADKSGFWSISDWCFLEKLTNLISLNLSRNQISDGRFLEKITGLTSLYLRDNQISDGRFLEKLTYLTSLDLGGNQISDGRFLERLTNLTSLNLNYNLINDGRFLEKLTNLTYLEISNNLLKNPPEVVVRQGSAAILKTLRDLHEEYRGIKASEIVPCPCDGCRTGKNKRHYFDFENLKNRLEKGRRTVECDKSLEEVELVKLLGDLFVFEILAVGQPVVMGASERVTRSHPLTERRKKIQALISENDIAGALEMLEMELGGKDVILLKNQWSQFQRQDNLALRTSAETSPERNRIIAALLSLAENAFKE